MHITRLSKASPQVILNSLFSPNWRSMFIGKAGAGKTYVLRNAGSEYNITLLGPSNLAAMVLGGQTLCSWLGVTDLLPNSLVNIDVDKVRRQLVEIAMNPSYTYRAVYIDEMSFFSSQVFNFIDELFEQINKYLLKEGLPIIYLIWGGDFLQLRTINGEPIHTSPLLSFYNITITEDVYRQSNEEWKECLSAVREGRSNDVKEYFSNPINQKKHLSTTLLHPNVLGPYGIHIVGTKADVKAQAALVCLMMSNGNNTSRFSYWNSYKPLPVTKPASNKPIKRERDYLHLTKGVRVKVSNGDKKNSLVKGMFGTVHDCSSNKVEVKFDSGLHYTYEYDNTSMLALEPGNVCTVHSIQGITIPSGSIALVDLNAAFTARTEGGLYVCLSRTERPEDTIITCKSWSDIRDKILTDKEVISKGLY